MSYKFSMFLCCALSASGMALAATPAAEPAFEQPPSCGTPAPVLPRPPCGVAGSPKRGTEGGSAVFAPAPGEDAADALQALIDANPHRTIHIPDGEYVLTHPVATPADPARAVSLRLADFAFLIASPDWAHTNAMVRLGGIHPANNNRAPGSVYGLYGGNIDGAGRATGISIESGRETRVQNVSLKRCHVGIHVMRGANSGSADCDIRDIRLVEERLNASDDVFRDYLQGGMHR